LKLLLYDAYGYGPVNRVLFLRQPYRVTRQPPQWSVTKQFSQLLSDQPRMITRPATNVRPGDDLTGSVGPDFLITRLRG